MKIWEIYSMYKIQSNTTQIPKAAWDLKKNGWAVHPMKRRIMLKRKLKSGLPFLLALLPSYWANLGFFSFWLSVVTDNWQPWSWGRPSSKRFLFSTTILEVYILYRRLHHSKMNLNVLGKKIQTWLLSSLKWVQLKKCMWLFKTK